MENSLNNLHWETVTDQLRESLEWLISEEAFMPFALVGGTNLSLRFGHRKSDDIDLFSPAAYGSSDFNTLEDKLRKRFEYCDSPDRSGIVAFGRSYYIGDSASKAVKLDLMYTDPFIKDVDIVDGIRLASVEDIAAMKISAICGNGRKKDYWDIHMLLDHFRLEDILGFYQTRHPYEYTRDEITHSLLRFSTADEYPDPKCLLGKDWDIIKMDLIDIVTTYNDETATDQSGSED